MSDPGCGNFRGALRQMNVQGGDPNLVEGPLGAPSEALPRNTRVARPGG